LNDFPKCFSGPHDATINCNEVTEISHLTLNASLHYRVKSRCFKTDISILQGSAATHLR